MKAEQYRPNFFSGFEKKENYFSNTKELLNIEWIKDFSNHNNFHTFSLNRDKTMNNHTLMAEYDNGCKWYVVAFIKEKNIKDLNDLIEWKPKKKKK